MERKIPFKDFSADPKNFLWFRRTRLPDWMAPLITLSSYEGQCNDMLDYDKIAWLYLPLRPPLAFSHISFAKFSCHIRVDFFILGGANVFKERVFFLFKFSVPLIQLYVRRVLYCNLLLVFPLHRRTLALGAFWLFGSTFEILKYALLYPRVKS